MKRLSFFFLILWLSACSYFVSTDELARNIESQMQRELNNHQDYRHYKLKVLEVKITERDGREFKAISQLEYLGKSYPVHVLIHPDGKGYSWELEGDAFAFIDEVEIQKYERQLQQELAMISAEFERDDGFDSSVRYTAPATEEPEPVGVSQRVEDPIPVGNITAYTN